MFTYLKEESHYSDRYDLLTIEECLRYMEFYRSKMSLENNNDKYLAKLSKEEMERALKFASEFSLYFIKGERYKNKASFIQECMTRDSKRNEILQNALEPRNIRCPDCSKIMSVLLKELYELDDESGRVLFIFECPACTKRKGYFDNGKEFKSKPELCVKCNKTLNVSHTQRGDVLIWSRECSSCGFTEKEEDDFNKMRVERIAREKSDQELLQKHRVEFCMSEAEGQEYLQSVMSFQMLSEIFEKDDLKQKDPDYKEAVSLNKWSIAELEKVLSETLAKDRFQKISFDKPEIDKYVIVSFTVQDFASSRGEKDSERKLQRLIKKAVSGSNWRLMTEGVSYRLGCLSGRLKGYEREEDLVQIIKQEKGKR